MRLPICPVCTGVIEPAIVSISRVFRCPHCAELLREQRRGPGRATTYTIIGAITLSLLAGRLGLGTWLGMMLLYPGIAFAIRAVGNAAFGYILEPVSEGGRTPLGMAEE
jgi:hypothetical protein